MVIKCGGQAKLDFGISGDPAPKVSWLLNGEPLPDDDKHCSAVSTAEKCSLVISSKTRTYRNIYSCCCI